MKSILNKFKKQDQKQMEFSLIEQDWLDAKRLSVSQKRHQDLYVKLMYSHGFRINNRNYIYEYIPFEVSKTGEVTYDVSGANAGEGIFWEVIKPAEDQEFGNGDVMLNRYAGAMSYGENLDDAVVSIDVPANVKEDFTINEIIDQKQLSFSNNKFILELSDTLEHDLVKLKNKLFKVKSQTTSGQMSQQEAEELTQAVKTKADQAKIQIDQMASVIKRAYSKHKRNAEKFMREAKWYPYSGSVFTPYFRRNSKNENEKVGYRNIHITPFNLDYDTTKSSLEELDYLVASERVTASTFIKRAMAGEYSEISVSTRKDIKALIKMFDEQSYNEFLPNNFPDSGLSRTTSLRWDFYAGGKSDDTKSTHIQTDNAYGVIDYFFVRNLEDTITLYTLLNGKVISKLDLADIGIDMYPVVLFSESNNINDDINYQANLAFRLISHQLEIQISNKKIAETQNIMQPLVLVQYTKDETVEDEHRNTSRVMAGQGMNVYLFYSKDPKQASNNSKIENGASIYTPYLKELEELKVQTQQRMKEAAGITDFLAGTDAHSMESKSGLSEMVSSGLKSELDVVKSHSTSLSDFLLTEVFFNQMVETVTNNLQIDKKRAELGSRYVGDEVIPQPITKLSQIYTLFKDSLEFSIESEFSKTQTASIISSVLIPLAAQIKQPQILFDLVNMLPVTQELTDYISGVEAKIEAAERAQLEREKEMEQHKADLANQLNLNKGAIDKSIQDDKLKTDKEIAKEKAQAAKKGSNKTGGK